MTISENTRLIPLTQGQFAIVDEADFEWLTQWKWTAERRRTTWYAIRGVNADNPCGRRTLRLHRFILAAPASLCVDHADGDGLNNTRSNLRVCTPAENSQNQKAQRQLKSSPYKGVSWDKRVEKWQAYIKKEGRKQSLGYYTCEDEAAAAYNVAALSLFGVFARLNVLP